MENIFVKYLEYMDLNLNPKMTRGHIWASVDIILDKISILKTLGSNIIIIVVIVVIGLIDNPN